jgi:hypothetical protein
VNPEKAEREPTQLEQFLLLGSERLGIWLADIEAGVIERPSNNRILGVAEHAEFRAKRDQSHDWGYVAVRAYGLVNVLKAMRLRAWFISKMGAEPGSSIRDSNIILDWFIQEIPFSMEVARQKCDEWNRNDLPLTERLSVADLRVLRGIKNRLGPIQALAETGQVPSDSACLKWLEIRRRLP